MQNKADACGSHIAVCVESGDLSGFQPYLYLADQSLPWLAESGPEGIDDAVDAFWALVTRLCPASATLPRPSSASVKG